MDERIIKNIIIFDEISAEKFGRQKKKKLFFNDFFPFNIHCYCFFPFAGAYSGTFA
jgi:hypothetical protein